MKDLGILKAFFLFQSRLLSQQVRAVYNLVKFIYMNFMQSSMKQLYIGFITPVICDDKILIDYERDSEELIVYQDL